MNTLPAPRDQADPVIHLFWQALWSVLCYSELIACDPGRSFDVIWPSSSLFVLGPLRVIPLMNQCTVTRKVQKIVKQAFEWDQLCWLQEMIRPKGRAPGWCNGSDRRAQHPLSPGKQGRDCKRAGKLTKMSSIGLLGNWRLHRPDSPISVNQNCRQETRSPTHNQVMQI